MEVKWTRIGIRRWIDRAARLRRWHDIAIMRHWPTCKDRMQPGSVRPYELITKHAQEGIMAVKSKKGFYWSSKAWYGPSQNLHEVSFGLYSNEGGTEGECAMR